MEAREDKKANAYAIISQYETTPGATAAYIKFDLPDIDIARQMIPELKLLGYNVLFWDNYGYLVVTRNEDYGRPFHPNCRCGPDFLR